MKAPAAAAGRNAADLPHAAHRIDLADIQRVLALFAQGLSGHYFHPKPTAAVAGDSVGYRMDGAADLQTGGAPACGKVLYLPQRMEHFASSGHNLGAYRIAVLRQLGLFENGTFEFSLDAARACIPLLSRLPEAHLQPEPQAPASGLERFFALWTAPGLMRRIFATLEGLRIDTALRRRYPGARADLERMRAHALHRRPDARRLPPAATLLESLVQYALGASHAVLLASDASGQLAHMLDAAARVEGGHASVYDSARAAIVCYRVLVQAGEATHSADEPQAVVEQVHMQAAAGLAGDAGAVSRESDASGVDALDFQDQLNAELVDPEMAGVSAGDLPDGAQGADEQQEMLRQAAGALLRAAPARAAHAAAVLGRPDPVNIARAMGDAWDENGRTYLRSYLYDEWDYHRQAYLKGWCRLYEFRLRGDDFEFIRDVQRRHAVLTHQVKRQFRFIRPESRQRVRRVSDGEELELDGVIEAVIDRHAGHASDARVYSRRDKALREVAAAFLLDMSASTDIPVHEIPRDPATAAVLPALPQQPGNDEEQDDEPMHLWGGRDDVPRAAPAAPKRRVIDVARESLAVMCQALQTLDDSYAIYGFSGEGRENVEFHVAKAFEDRLSGRTWAALAAMKARRSTRMGPAIRHALANLERQTARMKVLIIVSDGFPQDIDYGPDRTDNEYGIQDTAQALKEAERQGVQSFCVTIDPSGHDYLRRMCDANRYMVIDDVADLPRELAKVYRALTV